MLSMGWARKYVWVFPGINFSANGSLVGCRLWGRTESDTTEAT